MILLLEFRGYNSTEETPEGDPLRNLVPDSHSHRPLVEAVQHAVRELAVLDLADHRSLLSSLALLLLGPLLHLLLTAVPSVSLLP